MGDTGVYAVLFLNRVARVARPRVTRSAAADGLCEARVARAFRTACARPG
jgi:hypothetical protein